MINLRQVFQQHLAHTSDFPLLLEITQADGSFLFDANGKDYIDVISGIGVSNVGHRHPQVLEAIQQQLDKYLHVMVYGELVQAPQVKLAEALAHSLPDPLKVCFLVNSGSEAVEGALKLAKRYTGRYELVSCFNAYHGSSQGALSVCGNESLKNAYRPLLPGIKHIRFGQIDDLAVISDKTAAIIIETVQGEAGVRIASPEYWAALQQRCKETGTLLIMDEIQVGFGRTGTFWAFEQYPVVPDILVCAKGMGGGMPIGAFISSAEIMDVLRRNPILGHITTFGGHPVSAAASLATLHIIKQQALYKEAEAKAAIFKRELQHPSIKQIRNRGLLMAVEFESFDVLKPIIDQAIVEGVLTDWFLFCDNSMRLAPPLTITEKEIRLVCKRILTAIHKIFTEV